MPEILPIVLSVIAVIITIVLAVVGIQLIMVLIEVKKTLKKFNDVLDEAEDKFNQVIKPLQSLGGMASGLRAGFSVFESFVSWLQRNKEKSSH